MEKTKQAKKNKYLKNIDLYLKQNFNLSFGDLCTYLGIKEKSFDVKKGFPANTNKTGIQKPFTRELAARIKLGFNIPNEYLLLSEEDENKWKQGIKDLNKAEKKYILRDNIHELTTKHSPQNTLLNILNLRYYPSKPNKQNSFEEYKKIALPYIYNARKSILVSEYLNKGALYKRKYHLKDYQETHEALFNAIEVVLDKTPEMTYHRILAYSPQKPVDPAILIQLVIRECSLTTYKHIVRVLAKFSPTQKNGDISTAPKIRISVDIVSTLYHYGVFDDDILFTETYYSTRQEGKTFHLPDMLRIERCNSDAEVSKLKKLYKLNFHNALGEDFCITKENIRFYTEEAVQLDTLLETGRNTISHTKEMNQKIAFLDSYIV